MKRLDYKCLDYFGWTFKQTATIIISGLGLALFVALWLNGYLPNNSML